MLTCEKDLLEGIGHAKRGNAFADKHRKKVISNDNPFMQFLEKVSDALGGSGPGWYESMTPTERHAELVYAETLFEKALLTIVDKCSWLAFLEEA